MSLSLTAIATKSIASETHERVDRYFDSPRKVQHNIKFIHRQGSKVPLGEITRRYRQKLIQRLGLPT